jgi:hypothetical protein
MCETALLAKAIDSLEYDVIVDTDTVVLGCEPL